MVQTFTPHRADKTLDHGIRIGCPNRYLELLNSSASRYRIEVGAELTIIISNQVLGCFSKGCSFPQLLSNPGVGGRVGDPHMYNAARGQMRYKEGKMLAKENVDNWDKVSCTAVG
jgi:hypothetical protein